MESIITTSWDDGHPRDKMVSKLLEKYNIPGTFYIPPEKNEKGVMNNKDIRKLSNKHEIGAHSLHHIDLTHINKEQLEIEVRGCRRRLEEITSQRIISFAYPKGKYNKEVLNEIRKEGYKVARTTKLYKIKPKNPLILPVTLQTKNPSRLSSRVSDYIIRVLKNPIKMKNAIMSYVGEDWKETALKYLDEVKEGGGVFHLMGHSWQLDKKGFKKLEMVLKKIDKNRSSFKFITNSELADLL